MQRKFSTPSPVISNGLSLSICNIDKPDNLHDTSVRRKECTFCCSLVFYVVSWSHSMDSISTHQTNTLLLLLFNNENVSQNYYQ